MQRFLIALGVLATLAAIAVLVFYPTDSSPVVRDRAIEAAHVAFPGMKFSHAGDVTVFAAQGDNLWAIDITTLQTLCQHSRHACDKATTALVHDLKRTFAPTANPKVTDLRPTLAGPPADWPPTAQLVGDPLAGSLVVRYGFFGDGTVRFLTRGLAASLGLDPAKARPVAVDAMQSAPGSPILRPLLGQKGLSYIDAEADPAGEVLSTARLNVLLEKTGLNEIALGFPTRHMVVVANAAIPADVQMLRGFVDALSQRPQAHVVSRAIYRFDGTQFAELK